MPVSHTLIPGLALACVLGMAGCAVPLAPSCPPGMRAMKSDLLYFGTASPRGPVTPEQWSEFLEQSVTPRFPQGFTVWPADGQWRGDGGNVDHEAAWVLNIVHRGSTAEERAFTAIIDSYEAQFQQQAVLRVQGEVCANIQ